MTWPVMLYMQLFLSTLSGMANSVALNQTAPSAESALSAYAILSQTLVYEILEHLPYLSYIFCGN